MADVNVKTLQTRIALKYDSYSAWTSSPGKDLVLLKGEIGICEIPSNNANATTAPTTLFKVGDGVNTFENLRWASALAADVYDWAKSETVELDGTTIKFKTGDSVKHSIDLSSFATGAEVEGIVARIEDLEAKFTGTDSIQNQINGLGGRIDEILDDANIKSFADAKLYADGKETQTKAYADTAVAGAKTEAANALATAVETLGAADLALSNRIAALEGDEGAVAGALQEAKKYADDAKDAAIEAANGYTDGVIGVKAEGENAATGIRKEIADAEAAAKSYADGKVSDAVSTINAKDGEQDTAIKANTDNLAQEILDRQAADKAITDSIGTVTEGKTVVKMIEDAQAAAEANAATTAQGKVDALANGQVATNASDIEQLKLDLADEIEAREGADKELDERLVEVEAFFKTAENETLDTALDTLVEIQEYLNDEGSATGGLIDRIAGAEEDIDDLEKEFADNGRVTKAEAAIAEAQAAINTLNGEATEDGSVKKAVADALKSANDYTDEREDAITDAYKAYADEAETDAVESAKAYTDAEIKKLDATNLEITTDIENLKKIVKGYADESSIKTAVDAAQKAADDAQDAADKAQEEIDALELVVGHETTGLAATKAIADKNKTDIEGHETRIAAIESDYLKMADLFIIDCGTSTAVIHTA